MSGFTEYSPAWMFTDLRTGRMPCMHASGCDVRATNLHRERSGWHSYCSFHLALMKQEAAIRCQREFRNHMRKGRSVAQAKAQLARLFR